MASRYQLLKSFSAFKGLDLRSGDLLRAKEFASDVKNCDFRSTAALSKRKGYQIKGSSAGTTGIAVYSELAPSTGAITDKLVAADDHLHVRKSASITLTYSGGGTAYYELQAAGTGLEIKVFENDIQVLSQNLGTGLETSPITIADLTTSLNALTDFSASSSVATSTPAAFLDKTERTDIDSSASIAYNYFEQVNSPSSAPFSLHYAQRNSDTFEPASFVSTNGVLYISNGYDEMHKYDGQTLYRAGMPQGEQPSASLNGAGSITNSGLEYRIAYYQKDNKGNIVEGIISDRSASLSASSNAVALTLDNIQASSGFNTNCAIVDGAQTSVNTIDVDDGSGSAHTLQVGDTAYFFDGVSGSYVEREVTARTASSITIDGAAVTVSDNRPISNNLRIDIYRNQSAGDTFSLVASVPNDSFSATQGYNDNAADSALGAEYIEPIKERGVPPKGKYMTLFRGQMIVGGFINDVDAVAYSDIDSPEYFPAGQNRQNFDTEKGDIVSGVKALDSVLFVFKTKTIHTITGDLINDNYQVDILTTGGVGCSANATIQEVNGRLFFLDLDGVYSVTQGQNGVDEISQLISPEFSTIGTDFNFRRATAAHWLNRDKYVLFMPILETNGGEITSSSASQIYAYDLYRGGWLKWNNFSALGGMAVLNGDLYASSLIYNTNTSSVDRTVLEFLNTGTSVDYADHERAISAEYKTHWETLGEPSVFKKFLRLKLHSLDASVNDFETQLFTISLITEHDFNNVPVYNHVFDFGNGATGGWGENPWGASPWGDARLDGIKTKLKTTKARSIRLIFANDTINTNFLLSGYELETAAPFRIQMKE